MSYTKSLLLSLCFVVGTTTAYSQLNLHLNISAKPQPTTFLFGPGPTDLIKDQFVFLPVFQLDMGIKKRFGESWFWMSELSYRQAHYGSTLMLRDENNNPIADGVYGGYFYNFIGLKLGGGHEWKLGRSGHIFSLPAGFQFHLPFASKFRIFDDRFKTNNDLFVDDEFENGIFYGVYFRPTMNFALSKNRRNRWYLSLFGEADLLAQNKADYNPKVLFGGGVGVAYRLKD